MLAEQHSSIIRDIAIDRYENHGQCREGTLTQNMICKKFKKKIN